MHLEIAFLLQPEMCISIYKRSISEAKNSTQTTRRSMCKSNIQILYSV